MIGLAVLNPPNANFPALIAACIRIRLVARQVFWVLSGRINCDARQMMMLTGCEDSLSTGTTLILTWFLKTPFIASFSYSNLNQKYGSVSRVEVSSSELSSLPSSRPKVTLTCLASLDSKSGKSLRFENDSQSIAHNGQPTCAEL